MSDRFSSNGAAGNGASNKGGADYSPAGGGAPSVDVSGLTPRQVLALRSLLQCQFKTLAAQRAGASRQTVHRWLRRDSLFFKVLQHERKARLTPEVRVKMFASLGGNWQMLRDIVATDDQQKWAIVLHILGLRD